VAVVRARALVKTVGAGRAARRILAGADLDVHAGEVVAVLGRSGSGKSTLLHILGGLDRADSGTVEVAGRRLDRLNDRAQVDFRRHSVGFVFQFFHLIPELTGEENVLLPARMVGDGARSLLRGRELIERLGLGEVAGSLPHTLSGGEQQRFAMARALVNDPALVLADEPTGNLDDEAGQVALDLLRSIAGAERAVVLVTHDARAATVADRVLHLDDGLLMPSGPALPANAVSAHSR